MGPRVKQPVSETENADAAQELTCLRPGGGDVFPRCPLNRQLVLVTYNVLAGLFGAAGEAQSRSADRGELRFAPTRVLSAGVCWKGGRQALVAITASIVPN